MQYEDPLDYTEDGIRRKNDNAWAEVFKSCQVLDRIGESGECCLKADDLKRYGGREPRLMAKIESKHNVPAPLRVNKLCILPYESRGNYIIGHFDAFLDVDNSPEHLEVESIHVGKVYDTLDPYNISKEPSAILSAFNYGIIDKIVGDSGAGMRMTNFGRESTTEFEYNIDNIFGGEPYRIHVNGSQLEMDGVFESDDYIINVEAKMGYRGDFLARQLYYPYRLLEDKTDKDILNVFLTYSGGSIYTHVYEIDDPLNYNSFRLVGNRRFDFFEEISINEMLKVVRNTRIIEEPVGIPFPQADTMQKVFDAMELINYYPGITDSDLAYKMSIVGRQGGYYGNACKYLELTERERIGGPYRNELSRTGKDVLGMPPKRRVLEMVKLMARHETFNYFLNECLEQRNPPKKKEVSTYLADNLDTMDSSTETPGRRASTVIKWIDWVIKICNKDC